MARLFGAVIVTGKTSLEGGSNFAHLNGVALLSKGDISLKGTSFESSFFQGLVYTEGSVEAENLTVLGGLISNSQSPRDRVSLKDVRAIHAPELLEIDVGNPPVWSLEIIEAPEEIDQPGTNRNSDEQDSQPGIKSLSTDYNVFYDHETKSVRIVGTGKATAEVSAVVILQENSGSGGHGGSQVTETHDLPVRLGGLSSGEPAIPPTTTSGGNWSAALQNPTPIDGNNALDTMKGLAFNFPISLDELRSNPNALVGLTLQAPQVANSNLGTGRDSQRSSTQRLRLENFQLDQKAAQSLRLKILERLNPGRPTTRFNFDPNQFLNLGDKIRLLYWKKR